MDTNFKSYKKVIITITKIQKVEGKCHIIEETSFCLPDELIDKLDALKDNLTRRKNGTN